MPAGTASGSRTAAPRRRPAQSFLRSRTASFLRRVPASINKQTGSIRTTRTRAPRRRAMRAIRIEARSPRRATARNALPAPRPLTRLQPGRHQPQRSSRKLSLSSSPRLRRSSRRQHRLPDGRMELRTVAQRLLLRRRTGKRAPTVKAGRSSGVVRRPLWRFRFLDLPLRGAPRPCSLSVPFARARVFQSRRAQRERRIDRTSSASRSHPRSPTFRKLVLPPPALHRVSTAPRSSSGPCSSPAWQRWGCRQPVRSEHQAPRSWSSSRRVCAAKGSRARLLVAEPRSMDRQTGSGIGTSRGVLRFRGDFELVDLEGRNLQVGAEDRATPLVVRDRGGLRRRLGCV
jgi:hypothetical protein